MVSKAIPDRVTVAPVIGTITILGGVSHCKVTNKSRFVEAYGAVCTPVGPYPIESATGQRKQESVPLLSQAELKVR